MKTFNIKIEYDDKYSDVEVLQSIMGNIDIGLCGIEKKIIL